MPKDLTPQKIFNMVMRHVKLIVLVALLTTLISYGYSKFFIAPSYSASSLILIQNYDEDSVATQPTSSSSNRVNVSDIGASATLAGHCVILFQNSPDMAALQSGAWASFSQIEDSGFVRISTTSNNAQLAANVANQLAEEARIVFAEFFDEGEIKIINTASAPSTPSAPNISQNTLYGLIIGAVLGVLLAFFLEIIDTTIKPGDDLAKMYGLPVFAEIVDFEQEG